MVPGDTFAQLLGGILQVLASVVVAMLVGKLATAGLGRVYWAVIAWLVLDALEGFLRFRFPQMDVTLFQLGQGLKLPFALVILWQLCRLVFVHYPAIGSFASRALRTVIPICLILGLVSFLMDSEPNPGRSQHLHLIIAVTRAATTTVLVFELLLGAFAGWFPVGMKRNIARLLIGLMVLYSISWINMLLANSGSVYVHWSNVISALGNICVMVYWLVTLGKAGEVESASVIPAWNPARLAQMTGQLDQMQAQLSRRGYQ
jgi:hypothetical protein